MAIRIPETITEEEFIKLLRAVKKKHHNSTEYPRGYSEKLVFEFYSYCFAIRSLK